MWKDRPSATGGDWKQFKQDIIALYPELRRIINVEENPVPWSTTR